MTDLADWSVLEIEGVVEVAERAAALAAKRWAPLPDYDDFYQEALYILAYHPHKTYDALEEGLGVLHHRLWQDLTDYARKENRRSHLNISYDELVEEALSE